MSFLKACLAAWLAFGVCNLTLVSNVEMTPEMVENADLWPVLMVSTVVLGPVFTGWAIGEN